jgi:prepilin-type N-terminal cleavage/methylation domain-containing protein
MISKIRNSKAAFTLVEIMIVVAIIGLLAALAIPGFVKARKQSQGRRILNDARQLDAAIDQWALDKGKTNGATIVTAEAATYLKTGTWPSADLLGNAYSVGSVGSNQLSIAAGTKTALDGVGIDWGTF